MIKNTIKNAKLIKEDGQLYLDLTMTVEDEHSIKEVYIPKVKLGIGNYGFEITTTSPYELKPEYYIDFVGNKFECMEVDHVAYTVKVIKEKAKEMTISEIEKKLGYKIKIVGEGK